MDKFDTDDLYSVMFFEETQEQIEKIEQDLLVLENNQEDMDTINSIFRMAHSIKGSSATMGFEDMSKLSHHLESLLSKVRGKEMPIDARMMNVFFKSIDGLKHIQQALMNGKRHDIDIEHIVEEIESIIKTEREESSKADGMKTDVQADKEREMYVNLDLNKEEEMLCHKVMSLWDIYKIAVVLNKYTLMKSVKSFLIVNNLLGFSEIVKTNPENYEQANDDSFGQLFEVIIATEKDEAYIYQNIQSISEIDKIYIKKVREGKKAVNEIPSNVKIIGTGEETKKEERTTVRVDVKKIDKLLNLIGEFIIDKENLNQIGLGLKRKYHQDPLVHKLVNLLPHIHFIGSELQETIMSTRLLPFEYIFNRFPRMVRDLAQKCGKEVNFVIEGKETEIDKGMIEELVDPLTHILRNAVDHGLESTQERVENHKKAEGFLKLSARHEQNSVIIEIEDDGKGIDSDKIRKKVLDKGLASKEELRGLSEKDIIQYIFKPGFSTAKEVSDISGRGVGLDVVKSNVGKLNGMVDIQTELGKGTKFIIKLPLTLAIVQALLIREGEFVFALPISSVIETIRLKEGEIKEKIHRTGGYEVFRWREQILPVINIGKYYEVSSEQNRNKLFIVVAGHSEKKFALVVEKLIGEQEIVIKSMGDFIGQGKLFGNLQGISGVSILGDGSFAHIIDMASVTKA